MRIWDTKQKDAARMFFDFYSLSLLRFFAGEKTLNHECRVERIERYYTQTVEAFYEDIRNALYYSVLREFRHFSDRTEYERTKKRKINRAEANALSMKLDTLYDKNVLDKVLAGERRKELEGINLQLIADGFNKVKWHSLYGGKKWGKAAVFLLQKPKTTEQKELWIDRVLDLQHNCGHILNKTKFTVLSQRNKVYNPVTKGKRSILNHRRYARTIRELSKHASFQTQKLVNVNLNLLPEIVR